MHYIYIQSSRTRKDQEGDDGIYTGEFDSKHGEAVGETGGEEDDSVGEGIDVGEGEGEAGRGGGRGRGGVVAGASYVLHSRRNFFFGRTVPEHAASSMSMVMFSCTLVTVFSYTASELGSDLSRRTATKRK